MLPDMSALCPSATNAHSTIHCENHKSISTPTNPGQLPWFPNIEDEEDDGEDKDYKPEEMDDDEPLNYLEEDKEDKPKPSPLNTPITYCMSGNDAIVALRADMHNFKYKYNEQIKELSKAPSMVGSAARIVHNYPQASYPYILQKISTDWLQRLDESNNWIAVNFDIPGIDEDLKDDIDQLLQRIFVDYKFTPTQYESLKTNWKLLCDDWDSTKSHWNVILERNKELVQEGGINEARYDPVLLPPSGATVEQMLKKIIPSLRPVDSFISYAAIKAINNVVSNLLAAVDNINPEPKNFVLWLSQTLESMMITARSLNDASLNLQYDESDSDEIRNKNYLDDTRVSKLVYIFLQSFMRKVMEMTSFARSQMIQLRDVEDVVASILRGYSPPAWDRARAKIMAYIRLQRAQIEAAARTYAPGGQGAEEAARSFSRNQQLQ